MSSSVSGFLRLVEHSYWHILKEIWKVLVVGISLLKSYVRQIFAYPVFTVGYL
jgi:hypothetical protein